MSVGSRGRHTPTCAPCQRGRPNRNIINLELDTAPRVIAVPDDLQRALNKDKAAKKFFEGLSYSNKRRLVEPIVAAKAPETRQRRIEKTVSLLHDGKS